MSITNSVKCLHLVPAFRDNLAMPQLLRTRPVIDLSGSRFKKLQTLFYIVHGYVGHYNDEWAIILAHELLKRVSFSCM